MNKYYTVSQVAKKQGVSVQAIYQKILRGSLPKKKVLGRYVIPRKLIDTNKQ